MTHLSVVIPVYKAQDCLDELYSRLVTSLEKITTNFEIILVEDCGGDASWEKITYLANTDPRVKGLQFSRNFGQHYGISAGLDYCDGDWVVVMDCDLQDQPEEISKLYNKAQEGFDVVLADRGKRSDTLKKRLFSWCFYKFFNFVSGINYPGQVGNFRIISRRVVDNYRNMREQLRFFGGLINWMGFPTAYVTVSHAERFAGESSYNFRKLWKLAWEIIIAYSERPLKFSIKLGFIISGLALIFGIYIFTKSLIYGTSVQGWSSLMVSIYFIGGIIIWILGIIGLYLNKIFDEMKKRPLYIVKEFANLMKQKHIDIYNPADTIERS